MDARARSAVRSALVRRPRRMQNREKDRGRALVLLSWCEW